MNKYAEKKYGTREFGAGGSEGGFGRFFLGMVMAIGGIYLLLNNISVGSVGGMGMGRGGGMMGSPLSFGNYTITSGFVLIPFIFGLGLIFYKSNSYLGWFLTLASLIMLIFGVVTNIHFHFRNLSAFDLIVILVLFVGGIGILLSSLKSSRSRF